MTDVLNSHANGSGGPLHAAIVELLNTVPEVWSDLDYDRLSQIQQKALFMLVGSELIECRFEVEIQFNAGDVALTSGFSATGESGLEDGATPSREAPRTHHPRALRRLQHCYLARLPHRRAQQPLRAAH